MRSRRGEEKYFGIGIVDDTVSDAEIGYLDAVGALSVIRAAEKGCEEKTNAMGVEFIAYDSDRGELRSALLTNCRRLTLEL